MIKGEISNVYLDTNKVIVVVTKYTDAKDNLVQLGESRYSFSSAISVDDIIARAQVDVEEHCKALVVRTYAKNENENTLDNLKSQLVGYVTSFDEATIKINGKDVAVKVDGIVSVDGVELAKESVIVDAKVTPVL